MDPVTQGVLGGTLAQTQSNKKNIITATWLGILAGMAPDLDVLIRSNSDPLLFLQYHRQFTHSLIFIPLGALICATVFTPYLRWRKRNLSFPKTYLFCLLGYATHALLDACTTYGTLLFWPFSDERIAWNNISIIDPLYTLPLLALLITASLRKKPKLAYLGLSWMLIYPGIGWWQHERAVQAGKQLANERGHAAIAVDAKPSFANLLVWKLIYEHDDRYYVDAVRMGQSPKFYPGESIAKLNANTAFPWLKKDSQQANDLARFNWFSAGYLAQHPNKPNRVIDIRYSMLPNKIDALWFIDMRPEESANNSSHVFYDSAKRDTKNVADKLWLMIKGG